jgi:hypothetical protein
MEIETREPLQKVTWRSPAALSKAEKHGGHDGHSHPIFYDHGHAKPKKDGSADVLPTGAISVRYPNTRAGVNHRSNRQCPPGILSMLKDQEVLQEVVRTRVMLQDQAAARTRKTAASTAARTTVASTVPSTVPSTREGSP